MAKFPEEAENLWWNIDLPQFPPVHIMNVVCCTILHRVEVVKQFVALLNSVMTTTGWSETENILIVLGGCNCIKDGN